MNTLVIASIVNILSIGVAAVATILVLAYVAMNHLDLQRVRNLFADYSAMALVCACVGFMAVGAASHIF